MVTGEDETPQRSAWLSNGLSLVAVYVLGVAAWFVSREVIGTDPGPSDDDGTGAGGRDSGREGPLMAVGLALGYTSAVCYLCARIPQIIKNYKEKSTEGMPCQSCLKGRDIFLGWRARLLTSSPLFFF